MKILLLIIAPVLVLAIVSESSAAEIRAGHTFIVAAIQGHTSRFATSALGRTDLYDNALAEAARRGVGFAVLPESPMLAVRDRGRVAIDISEDIPGPTTRYFSTQAEKLKMWIAVPFVEKAGIGVAGHYETIVLLNPKGQIAGMQRKRTPRWAGNDSPAYLVGSPWDAPDSIDIGGYRIGLLFGNDLRIGIPRLAGRGAKTIFVVAGWELGEPVEWRVLCKTLAQEYGVNLVVANRVSGIGGIFRPTGEMISATNGFGVVVHEIVFDGQLLRSPLGLPSVPIPATYEYSEELASLGRDLFFDASLSSNGEIICASCHDPTLAFTNGKKRGIGARNKTGMRNVPSLLNVAYRNLLHWDGSSATLELQAKFPMSHVHEMDSHYPDLRDRVRKRDDYVKRFEHIGVQASIEFEDVARALATYQRTLLSANSPFDQYLYAKDVSAISQAARRGLGLFQGKAQCVLCHVIGEEWSLFADHQFHNTGVGYTNKGFPDLGRGAVSYGQHSGMFMTPSLRNVVLTAPFMHDGSIGTLKEVINFYNAGGGENPYLDARIKPLGLTPNERQDLEAFLRSLTGDHRFTPTGEPIFYKDEKTSGTIAAIQFYAEPGASDNNQKRLRKLVREAADNRAVIIVLPEYAETGRLRDMRVSKRYKNTEETFTNTLRIYKRWAVSLDVWIVATALDPNGHVAVVLLDDRGVIRARHNKIRVRSHGRDFHAVSGDSVHSTNIVVSSPLGRVGVVSGDDVARGIPSLTQLGAEIILVAASWETSDRLDWWELIRERASQNGVQVVVANLRDSARFKTTTSASGTRELTSVAHDKIEYFPLSRSLDSFAPAKIPLGLPPLPRFAKTDDSCVQMGRQLFFDVGLSHDGETSCASCHDPKLNFTDGRPLPRGVFGRVGQRNTQSLLNVAYRSALFWDGRAASLEDQIHHALVGWSELNSSPHRLMEYIESSKLVGQKFVNRRGMGTLKFADFAKCIADYERTLLSGNSPFDRFYFGGDKDAISGNARRGFEVFRNKGGCSGCHQITPVNAMFTDNAFHNTGIGFHERFLYLGYGGDGFATAFAARDQFLGEYATPSLRNVILTPPYMHDGSMDTLEEVVDYYDQGGARNNPFQDERIRPLGLMDTEKSDLISFLKTLSGDHLYDSSGINAILQVGLSD